MKKLLQRLEQFWFAPVPPERLAMLRILVGVFVLQYLATHYDMLIKVAHTDSTLFRPVGVAALLMQPLPPLAFQFLLIATLAANIAFIFGWQYRYTGPLFGGLLLALLCYRNSWSMIYHSQNPLVLHALILGVAPSAEAWSLDALRGARAAMPENDAATKGGAAGWQYGWPIMLICTVTVLTYFLCGVAKVTGPMGWSWCLGDAMRDQIAADALRKDLLGSNVSPLVYSLYHQTLLFAVMGLSTFIIELGAPAALLHPRLGRAWAIGAFLMHWGILFIMDINFRYQLSGLIFAAFFSVERLLMPEQWSFSVKRLLTWRRSSAAPVANPALSEGEAIVLFDGVCNFCNGTVNFILTRDRKERFKFAPLQSETSRQILARFQLPPTALDTIVLIEGGRCFIKSTAVLRIFKRLSGLWPLLYVFIILPPALRDFFYTRFASHRYQWFGVSESCMMPTPAMQARFLS